MEKALIIKGELPDLSDVLRIARAEGRKVLNVQKIRVAPVVYPYNGKDYLVVVSPEHDGGACRKPSDVGSRNKEQKWKKQKP